MPYVRYETVKAQRALNQTIQETRRSDHQSQSSTSSLQRLKEGSTAALTQTRTGASSTARQEDNKLWYERLIQAYSKPGKQGEAGNDLHLPRTLDQFYYHSLQNTEERDRDQVLYRYQGKLQQEAMDKKETTQIPSQQANPRQDGRAKKRNFLGRLSSLICATMSALTGTKEDDAQDITKPAVPTRDGEFMICMVDQLWLWIVDDSEFDISFDCDC